jgi:hypothetical protein
MIMSGSFLPSLLIGFSILNFTRASEPTLSWLQLPVGSAKHSRSGPCHQQACTVTVFSLLIPRKPHVIVSSP